MKRTKEEHAERLKLSINERYIINKLHKIDKLPLVAIAAKLRKYITTIQKHLESRKVMQTSVLKGVCLDRPTMFSTEEMDYGYDSNIHSFKLMVK